ncbi:MAG TPA: SIR2 family protein [Rhizomicrobium sp.]|nr:SIR2 family protein [Rhizomicrobium sp.]
MVDRGGVDGDDKTDRRDPYRDWPYAEAYLLETLDPDLIESHACQILSRALNVGRVVAFVGAGVAMSYGRISWRELVETEEHRVRKHLDDFLDDVRKKIGNPAATEEQILKDDPAYGHIRRLKAVLDSLKLKDVRSERFPMIFQLCEQLDNALFNIGWTREHQTQQMRQHAMELTIDERGHARQILIDALRDPDLDGTKCPGDERDFIADKLDERSRHVHQDVQDTTALRLFYQRRHAKILLGIVPRNPRCSDLINAIESFVDRPPCNVAPADGDCTNLLPTERYVMGVLLRLLPQSGDAPLRHNNAWWNKINEEVLKHVAKNKDRIRREDRRPEIAENSRSELVRQYRDPLLQLQERLEISRYLTTNYDHEIERLFDDQGYRRSADPSADESSTLLTSTVQHLVFDNLSAGNLIAFAARDRGRSGMVVHLHGRAEVKDDKAEIIVTESDYQRRYLRNDESRALVDDAISLTFGANPMIFVGSNMGEDDILRPLRQFMSNPSRVGDRVAVAFLPAMEERAKRTEEKIAHLGRYGVYTIHFGVANVCKADRNDPAWKLDECRSEWLPWVWNLKRLIEAELDKVCELDKKLDPKVAGANRLSELLSGTARPTKASNEAIRKALVEGPELPADVVARLRKDEARALRDKFHKVGGICAPTAIEGIIVDRERALDLDAEVEIFNAAIKWLGLVGSLSIDNPVLAGEIFREARAHRVALQGAGDAILAVFTCARLIRARWDWDDWKTRWYSIPHPRPASDGRLTSSIVARAAPAGGGSADPGLLTQDAAYVCRNAITLAQTPEGRYPFNRFYAGAPSQTFFGLLGALNDSETENVKAFRGAAGRRILLLSGRRGLGKGHFFSALAGRSQNGKELGDRLTEFLTALSPEDRDAKASRWACVAFYNLSFAQEVMSAFDDLAELLLQWLPDDEGQNRKNAARARFESLRYDRVERLRAMLTAWHDLDDASSQTRFLVVFNSVGILFDKEGRAKNGQIKRLFDLIFSDEVQSAPVDVILVSQDEFIPRAFREEHSPSSWKIIPLERVGLDAKGVAANQRQWKALGMTPTDIRTDRVIGDVNEVAWQRLEGTEVPGAWRVLKMASIKSPPTDEAARRPAVAMHILHEARGAIIAASYFPRVGVLLARHHLLAKGLIAEQIRTLRNRSITYPHVFEESAVEFRRVMQETLDMVKPGDDISPKILIPAITVALSLMLEVELIGEEKSELETAFKELRNRLIMDYDAAKTDGARRRAVAQRAYHFFLQRLRKAGRELGLPKGALRKHRAEFVDAVHKFDHHMRDLHLATGGGRFLLTLVFAGAYETTTSLTTPSPAEGERRPPLPLTTVDAATYSVNRFLERVVLSLRGVHARRKSDVVVQQYLGILHRHHERGENMPLAVRLGWDGTAFVKTLKAKPEMHRLFMEILWHLSIIGQAVEADVLAWCPRVRQACDELKGSTCREDEHDNEYLSCVKAGLELGINRCLIFEILPEKEESSGEEKPLPRYGVHGLIQRDVFQKLGAPDAEFTDTEQFTLSLYASQPDELPKLNRDAHNQIAATIAALAGYPDMGASSGHGRSERGARAELHRAEKPSRRKRLLRAAFGIMRSIYSVAVLARFDHEPQGVEGTPGHEGYFEEYRRTVRWMVTAALDLGEKDHQKYAPFFAEEIVWLYNECAVLSLVQGRLADAHALFDAALLAAKKVEPGELGALHVRILLNKAVSDIERGHGASAREYLQRIACMVDEHPVPPLLAKGYLGLIDHLAGEVDSAVAEYKEAIEGLIKLRRARAASIFSRHYGDLLAKNLGERRHAEAKRMLHNAIHLAQEGGHEDIRHMALLSMARCQMDESASADSAQIHNVLDNVERYARLVGMPRLLCEVDIIRARLLFKQGEVRLAGSLATRCLQIATVNDLRIRKITSLLLLAEIHLKRNEPEVVRPLLSLGAKMANNCNHFFALTSAQEFQHLLDQAPG